MIWMGMSSKGTSDHQSKQAVNQEIYLKECINERLLFQIFFGQSTLLKYCSTQKNLPFVSRFDNSPKLV